MKNYIIFIIVLIIQYSCVNENEFQKPISVFETSTVLDKQGNKYATVKIGNQWWMQEDLKATQTEDGSQILKISDATSWISTNNPAFMVGTTGNLYNYATVENAKDIIPEGWHVATDEDFKILEMELGMSSNEVNDNFWRGQNIGSKLKEDYQKGAWSPYTDIWGDNESGFKALPCGCVLFDGRFCEPNNLSQGYWWTSSQADEDEVWFRYLDYKSNDIFRYVISRKYGMAIRCVKN